MTRRDVCRAWQPIGSALPPFGQEAGRPRSRKSGALKTRNSGGVSSGADPGPSHRPAGFPTQTPDPSEVPRRILTARASGGRGDRPRGNRRGPSLPERAPGSPAPRACRKSPGSETSHGARLGAGPARHGHAPGRPFRGSALRRGGQLARAAWAPRGAVSPRPRVPAMSARGCPGPGSLPAPRPPVHGPKGQGTGAQ